MWKQLWAKKDLAKLLNEMKSQDRLHRVLGPTALTSLGVGAIIGAGIFVMIGEAASKQAGPALMLSFVVSAITCVFAAMCYAEFASMAPVAGSAYTYSYTTMGELFAWIIGWDLILEYAVASAAVAQSWSEYAAEFVMTVTPESWAPSLNAFFAKWGAAPIAFDEKLGFHAGGGVINLLAILITAIVTTVLVIGIKESARFNTTMVLLKVGVVLFVIGVGVFFIKTENWTNDFAPYGYGGISMPWESHTLHPTGMLAGAATIFFAYIGFDSISTHAEEAKNPQRDVPIAIIGSLVICTILYILVAAVLTGMVPFKQIPDKAPVASAFRAVDMKFAGGVISLGAVAGMTSVLLVMMLSQPRVLLAMARDGLLPEKFFGAVHEKFRTPYKSTILTGVLVALASSLLPRKALADMVNIGTLLAFVLVCVAVMIMRRTNPNAERPFRAPFGPVIPVLGIITCLVLMLSLGPHNWLRLAVWLGIGMVIYFCYGKRHSHLGRELRSEITQHGLTPTNPSPPKA